MNKQNLNDYALPFAAWELRLYLDTHPDDGRALTAYKQLCAAQGGCTYACHTPDGKGGSGTAVPSCHTGGCAHLPTPQSHAGKGARWRWIDGPWPWEPEANMTGGNC